MNDHFHLMVRKSAEPFYYFIFLISCACIHVYASVVVCTCVCTWMCGTCRVMSGIILNCSSILFIVAESLNQTQSSPIWLVLLATLFWGIPCLHLWKPHFTVLWGIWILIIVPTPKYFNYWVISLALSPVLTLTDKEMKSLGLIQHADITFWVV